MTGARRRQRGVALVIVLWASVLLTVIASSFIVERRSEALVVRNSMSLARAESAADAGVYRGVMEMYRGDAASNPNAWKRDGSAQAWTFDSVPVTVELLDESAKIDINTAPDALLRGLLASQGLAEEDVNRLLDAILDWRDTDALKRANGAEEADYRAAGLAYKPANAPFQAIEELQLVLGMRPDLYRRLAPLITVFSRQGGVNTQIAPREVLLAIPGVTAEIVDPFLQRRDDARAAGQPLPTLPQAGQFNSGNSMVATIRSVARLEDGTYFAREAVALLRPVPRRPVTFVAWRESTAPPPAPEPAADAAAASNPANASKSR